MGAVIRTIDSARQDYAYADIVKAIKDGNRTLDLTYRNLRNVPKLLSSLRDIVELQLSFNLLTDLPNSIGSMQSLAILRVNNCSLESLVCSSAAPSLVQLANPFAHANSPLSPIARHTRRLETSARVGRLAERAH